MRIGKRRSRRIRLGRAMLIVAALAVNAGSSVAMALQSARQSTSVASQSFATDVAKCRGGRTAVSGGFASPGFDPADGGPTIGRLDSKRVDERRIETQAFNFGNQAGKLVSFAYCAAHDHGLRVKSASTSVKPNSVGSAVARCPEGTEAVGGGFSIHRFSTDQGPQVLTLTSKRLGERRWKVVGVNIPFGAGMQTGKLIAHAYCEDAPFKLVTRSKEVTAPGGTPKTFDVHCPNGSGAFSGGFDGQVQIQGSQSKATAAVTSRRASEGRVWRTSALSVFGNPGPVTAYAYCRER
jgi:hypothetical protein